MSQVSSNRAMQRVNRYLLHVLPSVQQYDWGKKGSASEVAKLYQAGSSTATIDEEKPYAELWMGTHPSSPSRVVVADQVELLSKYLGHELPYLFKVLSVQKALSIQSHPDKKLAEQLHVSRPDLYKDDNHKPEMAVAVTDFMCMCGFRPPAQIAHFLATQPEFRQLVGEEVSSEFEQLLLQSPTHNFHTAVKEQLRKLFNQVMSADNQKVASLATSLVSRVSQQLKESSVPQIGVDIEKDTNVDENKWAKRCVDVYSLIMKLNNEFPLDVGVFSPFLLNCFRLNIGEAIFLPPNEPHAYLYGDIIEVMACSDNVVRAGLTPKPKDVPTLVSSLTYNTHLPEILTGKDLNDSIKLYSPPYPDFPEFRVFRVEVSSAHSSVPTPAIPGASLMLVFSGEGHVQASATAEKQAIKAGQVLLVPAETSVILHNSNSNPLVLFTCAQNAA